MFDFTSFFPFRYGVSLRHTSCCGTLTPFNYAGRTQSLVRSRCKNQEQHVAAPLSLPPGLQRRPPCGVAGQGNKAHGRVMILDGPGLRRATPVGLTVTFNRYPLHSALWLRGAGLVNALPWEMRLWEMLRAHHSAPRIAPTTAPRHSRYDTPTTAPLHSRFDTPTTAPLHSRFDMARPSTL
jgi:hypothetical protein